MGSNMATLSLGKRKSCQLVIKNLKSKLKRKEGTYSIQCWIIMILSPWDDCGIDIFNMKNANE